MANPKAERPFVIIDHRPDGFCVQTMTPPSGIWRRSGEPVVCSEYQAAQEAAALLAMTVGGSFAVTFDAILAMPGVMPNG